jgi:hypothetical protein
VQLAERAIGGGYPSRALRCGLIEGYPPFQKLTRQDAKQGSYPSIAPCQKRRDGGPLLPCAEISASEGWIPLIDPSEHAAIGGGTPL